MKTKASSTDWLKQVAVLTNGILALLGSRIPILG